MRSVSQLVIFLLIRSTHCFIVMLHHLHFFSLHLLMGFNIGSIGPGCISIPGQFIVQKLDVFFLWAMCTPPSK